MIKAAGILFLVGDTALFLRRGNGSDHPNEWCNPGGQIEDGETAEAAAIRETREETGFEVSPGSLHPWCRTVAPATPSLPTATGEPPAPGEDCDFTTFVVKLKEQFTPRLCDEHDGYAWAPVTAPPQPIHPGVQVALDRLGWNELDVAEAMAEGRLTSPQKYENLWLFNIRITGTGVAYRHGRKEFCWRDPELYMNERFLKRIGGLATIWEHPTKGLLNGAEYTKRSVGAVFLPYLRPDLNEVWAVVRIQDEEVAHEMRDNQMSTSPAVNFADPTENDRIKLEDGKIMLIEGDPSLIDHIAICPAGVWDKGGDPTGVETAHVMADALELAPPGLPVNKINLLRAYAGAFTLKAHAHGR
jgi:8-oxo-dGTP pyrophosphatase MutT (NUDIX family)